ncbi:MAG: RDD family protein [Betaproteobacteria bacterium]|nr:RDD family protein [Betaproteobacteria bacterium]
MPLLDTVRTIETPEGVSIRLRLAGPAPRALAWLLDFLIRNVAWGAIATPFLSPLGDFGFGIYLICTFLIEWFYPVLFEVYSHGATPGKKALGLAVLQDDGVPVSWSASVTRNLLRVVDLLPLLYAFGLCSMFLNRDFKRLGDIVAKTIVVHRDKPKLPQKLPPGHALPLPIWLSSSEQQLIVAFAARIPRLTPDRAKELAQILDPEKNNAHVPGATPAMSVGRVQNNRQHTNAAFHTDVDSLLGYARHIVGER